MNKLAIKKAAGDFMSSLVAWKDKEKIRKYFEQTRQNWTEEELQSTVKYETGVVAPVITAFQPIYNMAQAEAIDEPFDFSGYMTGQVGRVLGDELSYPEITNPYYKLVDLFKGGLETREFWETDYCKKHLLPKNFEQFQVNPYNSSK